MEDSGVRRLYKSEKDKVIDGVCGGIAEYLSIDPVVVRLIFVLLAIFGASGIIIYIILMLILPKRSQISSAESTVKDNAEEMGRRVKENAQEFAKRVESSNLGQHSQAWLGLIILALGVYFLLGNFAVFPKFDLWKLWPVVLVLVGFSILRRRS